MWVFLTTETLFFGALFFAYTVGRLKYPEAFAAAGRHTDLILGTLNTAILLTSSLFMALALEQTNRGMRRAGAVLLEVTAAFGIVFLVIKATEYWIDFRNHLIPGADFTFDASDLPGAKVFFTLYFVMTGVHALHLAIGIVPHAVHSAPRATRRQRAARRSRTLRRLVLAFRRRHLGLPVSLVVSRCARMRVLAHPLVRTWLALMVLLFLTVGSSLIGSWGIWNLVINLAIAAIKAALIVVVFMEIARSTLSVRVAALTGLVWLALLIGLGLADFLYRLTLG